MTPDKQMIIFSWVAINNRKEPTITKWQPYLSAFKYYQQPGIVKDDTYFKLIEVLVKLFDDQEVETKLLAIV